MNTADLQFNIIYTPKTVECLAPLVQSLLRWTNCRYRLVANACSADERLALQQLAATDDRLDYLLASENEMLEHGKVLNWLHDQCNDEYFCFMDSDIIATGPYMEQLSACVEQCDVFSSGHPLWYAEEDILLPVNFRRWQGSYCSATDGTTLGFTYFAVYRNDILTRVRNRWNVGFAYAYWDDQPAEVRQVLDGLGLRKIDYDTGKLLMSLMLAEGARFSAAELQGMQHLGGVSARAGDEPVFHYRGLLDKAACRLFGGSFAAPLFWLADAWLGWRYPSPGLTPAQTRQLPFAEKRIMQSRARKRVNTARYFTAYLQHLLQGTAPPEVPQLGHAPAEQRIRVAAGDLHTLFTELGLTAARRE